MTPPLKHASAAAFVADGGPAVGAGHIRRCLALAAELDRCGWKTVFILTEPSARMAASLAPDRKYTVVSIMELGPRQLFASLSGRCDVLVLDHYGLDSGFESDCRPWAQTVVAIDDLANRPHDCDLLVDSAPEARAEAYAALLPAGSRRLFGPRYAPIDRSFALARQAALARRTANRTVERILVSFGASDVEGWSATAVEAIAAAIPRAEIDVAVGAASPSLGALQAGTLGPNVRLHIDAQDMASLAASADLAVGAGGVSALERCCVGLPTVLLSVAPNQVAVADSLHSAGAAWHIGEDRTRIEAAVRELAGDSDRRRKMSEHAARLCDGLGARRVAMGLLLDGQIGLRPAEQEDRDLLFAWQQDPRTRPNARDTQPPSRAKHDRWFAERLSDFDDRLMIIMRNSEPVGVLRIAPDGEVSIYVDPACYGQGVGRAALRLARRLLPGLSLKAEVMPGNTASHALFRGAGFIESGAGLYVLPGAKPCR
jgi:UDP-2,4-diacetamido-2,4,6-trideoxy-beta-L-altropyranose hydrolase